MLSRITILRIRFARLKWAGFINSYGNAISIKVNLFVTLYSELFVVTSCARSRSSIFARGDDECLSADKVSNDSYHAEVF